MTREVGPPRPPCWQSQGLVASQVSVGQARPGLLEGTLHASSWGAPPPRIPHSLHLASLAGVTLLQVLVLGLPPASRVPQPGTQLPLDSRTGYWDRALCFHTLHHQGGLFPRKGGDAVLALPLCQTRVPPTPYPTLPIPPASLSGKSPLGQPQALPLLSTGPGRAHLPTRPGGAEFLS